SLPLLCVSSPMARRVRRPFLVMALAVMAMCSTCSLFLSPRSPSTAGAVPRLRASRAIYGDESIGPRKPEGPSLVSRIMRGGAVASMLALGSVLGYTLRRTLPGLLEKASQTIRVLSR
ncbi:hypothetical protein FOZ62_016745, partial [Perkinsus olseni]